ncbi:XrtA system polysaccharide chain length determinant [Novosphingobium piscinae]|uniref:Chain-length determining protein n=1 Tax=Novosphingobium piscinae TaxID=1507448 RepID=A0A7X1FZ41_9SPHN|nr:XrtA system polysaccharide chain length determinant [Novosphingobium piscinae]MBC2669586.1 chain-length determining protein [Novosphingobium piscinae]
MNGLFDEARAALFSVWHRKWIALGIAWGVCLLGWLAVAAVPNSYQSKARIFVQLDDPLAEQIGIGAGDRRRDIERVRQTLTSAINLEKVVRSTRLGDGIATPKQMEAMVLDLGKAVKVSSEQDNLFEITATSTDRHLSDAESAKLAQDIAQKMIDIFREENLAGGRGEMAETLEFMNQQLADRQKQLETAEQRRLQFEAQHPELSQGGASLLQRMEASRMELRGLDADIAAAQSALAAINGQLAGTPQSLIGPGSGGAKSALSEALGQLAALKARGLTDSHPDVIAARNQVAQLRTLAGAEGPGGGVPNPAYSSLQSIRAEKAAALQGLLTRRAAAQADLARTSGQQVANPEAAAEAQRISRDYDVLKQQYDKLLLDREQLRLRGQVETERSAVKFQVIDPPTTPRKPVAPNRPLLLLAVLVVGIGAGIAGAFAVGQLRSGFHTTGRLEKALGLPVLGAISHTMTDAGRALAQRRLKYFMAGSAALGVVFVLLLTSEFIQRGMVA